MGEDIRGIDVLHVLRLVDGVAMAEPMGPIVDPPSAVAPATGAHSGSRVDAEVRHVDGRAWRVTCEAVPWESERAESCTGGPVEGVSWMGTLISRAPTWH
jgi:hypothetical protein